jgi:large subunit ribosomal protein L23
MANLFIHPRATEKAYGQTLKNVYVFNVPLDSTKREIAATVEKQYDVKVVNVTTIVQNGKAIRFNRGKNKYPGTTNRKDTKKAYVTLAAGNSIKVFAEPESAPAGKEEKK